MSTRIAPSPAVKLAPCHAPMPEPTGADSWPARTDIDVWTINNAPAEFESARIGPAEAEMPRLLLADWVRGEAVRYQALGTDAADMVEMSTLPSLPADHGPMRRNAPSPGSHAASPTTAAPLTTPS